MPETSPLDSKVFPLGPDGVVVRFGLAAEPAAMAAAGVLAAELEREAPVGVVEVVPALASVFLRFDPGLVARGDLVAAGLARAREIAAARPVPPEPVRRWTIPAAFGGGAGPQLVELARRLGMREEAAVAELCTTSLRVLTIGFAPGQPYIGLLPEGWNIPRLAELTPQVPAGAIAVAVRQIVLFGQPSTTGWRQVGISALRCFRPERAEPMPLRAGDAIRFAPADAAEIEALKGAPDGLGGARLEVLR